MENQTCKDRIKSHLKSRINDLRQLWEAEKAGDEEVEDLGNFYEYGLSFDYVPVGTFPDQKQGYFRYQISWGGPSEEFRFFVNSDYIVYKIEFWFLDWFDGAKIILKNKEYDLMEEIYNFFNEIGSCKAEFDKAMED